MPFSASVTQSQNLRFTDAALEATYQADRRERDSLRAQRVQLALAIVASVLGGIIVAVSLNRHLPIPRLWLVLRFGVLVPGLLLSSWFIGRAWGKVRLQTILGIGVAIFVGAHALEWILEWTPEMPLRALWMVPIIMLWAVVMTLPMGTRSALGATLGVLVIAQIGITEVVVPSLGARSLLATAFAYGLCGYGLVLFAHWRERDNRELFLHRHEHQRLVAELRAQYETLQQLITQRNEFVAGVLHDLRSPLTAVLLNTELLRSATTLPPAVRLTLLDDIARSAKRVDSFANRFLEQRSLERAAAKPTVTAVLLGPVVERAVAHARLSAGHKNQRIDFTATASAQTVVADELLLDRALGNLLDNAVKYSPLGAAITVQLGADPGATSRTRVSVTDAGPGLSRDEQARLFQPYIMLGKKPTGGEPSTGLGLSLVKHCIEGMGGAVGCESESGRGATFWLNLRHA